MTVEETIDKLMQLRLPHMASGAPRGAREGARAARSPSRTAWGSWSTASGPSGRTAAPAAASRTRSSACRPASRTCGATPPAASTRPSLRSLGACQWVRAKQNVIVIGMTGTGKSYISAALAEAACRRGYRALRARVPRLLDELAIARADGSYGATLSRLAKLDVLVLDDLLIAPLKDTERRDLLEVLEDRYDQRSTVVTSQVPTKSWHEMLADPTVADAICDRLVHNAHVLSLKGPSIRKKKGLGEKNTEEKG